MDDLRQRLLSVVTDVPGANTRQAATIVGVPESSADYHLRRLVKEGELTSEFNGRTRHWYARSCGLCPVLRRAVPALRRPEARALALALDEQPASAVDAARRAGLPLGTVRWAATVLESSKLVTRSSSGRLVLRPGARTCLERAVGGSRCPDWGRCPVSRAILEEHAGGEGQPAWPGASANGRPAVSDAREEGYTGYRRAKLK